MRLEQLVEADWWVEGAACCNLLRGVHGRHSAARDRMRLDLAEAG